MEVLTEVRFEHEYFKGMFTGFKVRPSASSQKVLANFGMAFREQSGFFLFILIFFMME